MRTEIIESEKVANTWFSEQAIEVDVDMAFPFYSERDKPQQERQIVLSPKQKVSVPI